MRESFRGLLLSQGFQLRLSPKGTLPFDTEATIRAARQPRSPLVRARPTVAAVSPVLGGQLHFPLGDSTVTATRARRRSGGAGRLRARRGAAARRARTRSSPTTRRSARIGRTVGDTRARRRGLRSAAAHALGRAHAAHRRTRAIHLPRARPARRRAPDRDAARDERARARRTACRSPWSSSAPAPTSSASAPRSTRCCRASP